MPARKPTPAAKRKAADLLKQQKAKFLATLEDKHLVTEAAKQAGIHRQRAYEWRQADPDFATAWADIEERSTELLEREAYRRAAVGTEKPIYQGGKLVGTIREFSDTLLIFLLNAKRPAVYRANHRVEHGVDDATLERLGEQLATLFDRTIGAVEMTAKQRAAAIAAYAREIALLERTP